MLGIALQGVMNRAAESALDRLGQRPIIDLGGGPALELGRLARPEGNFARRASVGPLGSEFIASWSVWRVCGVSAWSRIRLEAPFFASFTPGWNRCYRWRRARFDLRIGPERTPRPRERGGPRRGGSDKKRACLKIVSGKAGCQRNQGLAVAATRPSFTPT